MSEEMLTLNLLKLVKIMDFYKLNIFLLRIPSKFFLVCDFTYYVLDWWFPTRYQIVILKSATLF